MPPAVAAGLIALGAAGVLWKTVHFVRVTIPGNYGSNPGFGAYETTVVPWWGVGCIGLSGLTSWGVGAACLAVGLVAFGFIAQILGRVFGNSA